VAVPDSHHHGVGGGQLDPAGPHFDMGRLPGIEPEKVGFGIEGFEIAADGEGFGDHRSVVEHQSRGDRGADLGEIGGALVAAGEEVEFIDLNVGNGFLGHEPAHAAGVWGEAAGVEFHHSASIQAGGQGAHDGGGHAGGEEAGRHGLPDHAHDLAPALGDQD